MTDDLIWTSAHELGAMYRSGEVSPVEVVDAVLDRLEEVEEHINAFVTVTAELARDDARKAEESFRKDEDLHPLHGVPMSVKDLSETSGIRTTYGSPAFADFVPDYDSIAWERLKATGVILIGKTTTPDFGLLGVTESTLTGTTSTPWDPERASGGSSGGAAASVAAGVAPLAWGSDGGGSIRVPSSLCGAVGIKPSVGRIPHLNNFEADTTDGPITRVVADAAMLLDATAGRDDRDRFTLANPEESFVEAALREGDLSGMRIAFSPDLGQGPIDPEVRRVFGEALDHIRNMGAIVEQVEMDLPPAMEYVISYWGPIYQSVVDEMEAFGLEPWETFTMVAERARELDLRDISHALREGKTQLYEDYMGVFATHELLLTPTTPTAAFPHVGEQGGPSVVDGVEVEHAGGHLHALTESPTHAGMPALSVPCGFTDEGLPVGLQIVGPRFGDADIIFGAACYERSTDWTNRHPLVG